MAPAGVVNGFLKFELHLLEATGVAALRGINFVGKCDLENLVTINDNFKVLRAETNFEQVPQVALLDLQRDKDMGHVLVPVNFGVNHVVSLWLVHWHFFCLLYGGGLGQLGDDCDTIDVAFDFGALED